MATMKAVRIHQFGGPEVLTYEDAPKPEPKDGEVLIKVAASSVNPLDWKIRSGQMEAVMPHTLPLILGLNAGGTVEAVGPGATAFQIGDEVYAGVGMIRDGSYAEYVTAEAGATALKPKTVDFVMAVSVQISLTAWQALFDVAKLGSGQAILIHGAGGAVGSAAVQFAKTAGATVICTATGDDIAYVRELGADTVIDYKTEKFEDYAHDVDVVLDTIGGETQARSWATLKSGGILVATTAPPDAAAAAKAGVTAKMINVSANTAQLSQLADLVDAGKLKMRVGLVFPLSEAQQAHEAGQTGRIKGKIALTVGNA